MPLPGHTIYIPRRIAERSTDGPCFINRFWIMHPEQGIAFYLTELSPSIMGRENEPRPQCDSIQSLAEVVRTQVYPDHELVFIPVVYAGHARVEQMRLWREQQRREVKLKPVT